MAYKSAIISIIAGIYLLYTSQTRSDEFWINLTLGLGIILLILGILNLIIDTVKENKKKRAPKPACEYCGYIALDERELHNHQITCEKKKQN